MAPSILWLGVNLWLHFHMAIFSMSMSSSILLCVSSLLKILATELRVYPDPDTHLTEIQALGNVVLRWMVSYPV